MTSERAAILPTQMPAKEWIQLDRALFEFRRGRAVVLHHPQSAVATVAAELVNEAVMGWLAGLGVAPPAVIITRHGAEARGLPLPERPGEIVAYNAHRLSPGDVLAIANPLINSQPPSGLLPIEGFATDASQAAIALCKMAELLPAALVWPLPAGEAAGIARRHALATLPASQLSRQRPDDSIHLTRVADARVPLADAQITQLIAFRPRWGGAHHLAIVIGEPDPADCVLVRVHSECFTGDLLGSLRCDCGDQLRGAIREIGEAGAGILLYLAQEGRGIGLINKLRAYTLQDAGLDTVDANLHLGYGPDERIYTPAAQILRELGVERVRLMTNNPDKVKALSSAGVEVVERVPHVFGSNEHNQAYLNTKATRSGHLF